MKEIGGYLELERDGRGEYYNGFIKYNLGRTACADFLKKSGAKKIYLPYFLCLSIVEALRKNGFECAFYHINIDFLPDKTNLPKALSPSEWLYVNNAYGQISRKQMEDIENRYGNVLFDNTHAFFQKPISQGATFYSVRKFFGVSDGAYLYTEKEIEPPKKIDVSYERYRHILGRLDETASAHYHEMLKISETFDREIPKRMSRLTEELLGAIDYKSANNARKENYKALDQLLGKYNFYEDFLRPDIDGPFTYPMLVKNGINMRKSLAEEKIYVPTYWSNVLENGASGSIERNFAANMLALPIDQRYNVTDMERVAETVCKLL